jgi:hypothetical protein
MAWKQVPRLRGAHIAEPPASRKGR